jgi:hypothetical protein
MKTSTTTAATETMTPSERANEIARAGGHLWATEMLAQCRDDEERRELIDGAEAGQLETVDFGALRTDLRDAGLESHWHERGQVLRRIEVRAALDALREAAE